MSKIKAFFISTILILSVNLSAQKVAYFNSELILSQIPEYAEAQKKLEDLQKQYADKIKEMQDELQNKAQKIANENQLGKYTQAELDAKSNEIYAFEDKIRKYAIEADQAILASEQKLLADIHNKVALAIKKISDERGYTAVFDRAPIYLVDNNGCDDITKDLGMLLGIK